MSRAATVLRRLAGSLRYRVSPSSYWNRRHGHYGHELDGAGLCGLGEQGNKRDYWRKWNELSSLLERHGIERDSAVLDAGCGPGWMTRRLWEAGFETRGVDFSEEAVRLARDRTNPAVRLDVSPLSRYAPGERFDAVCCIDVLFHVVDDREWTMTVKNLGELTEPSGLLVIQEHFDGTGGRGHVRWRDLADYERALEGWSLAEHVRYRLGEEGVVKDLIAFRRSADSNGGST